MINPITVDVYYDWHVRFEQLHEGGEIKISKYKGMWDGSHVDVKTMYIPVKALMGLAEQLVRKQMVAAAAKQVDTFLKGALHHG